MYYRSLCINHARTINDNQRDLTIELTFTRNDTNNVEIDCLR